MVAKKTPAKKMPPTPKKEVQASKPPAKKAASQVNRTDAAGSSGMGQTKSGVKALATDAANRKYLENFSSGISGRRDNSSLIAWSGGKTLAKGATSAGASKAYTKAEQTVLAKYGMASKKKASPVSKVPAKKAAAPAKRTDKAGSSGMGQTKSGVEARAVSASMKKGEKLYPLAGADWASDYTNVRTNRGTFGGTPSQKGKKITDQQATKIMLAAGNAVRKQYGIKPKKK